MRCSSQRAIHEVVADLGHARRADLELPLTGHHLGVGAGDLEAGVEARLRVLLDDVATRRSCRRRRRSSTGPAARGSRPSGKPRACRRLDHRVLLLQAEPEALRRRTSSPRRAAGARVLVGCGAHVVGQEHLAHHQDVAPAADRVGTGEDGLEDAVGLVARGLLGASSRRTPRSAACHAVVEDLGLGAKLLVGSVPSSQMYSAWYATN